MSVWLSGTPDGLKIVAVCNVPWKRSKRRKLAVLASILAGVGLGSCNALTNPMCSRLPATDAAIDSVFRVPVNVHDISLPAWAIMLPAKNSGSSP